MAAWVPRRDVDHQRSDRWGLDHPSRKSRASKDHVIVIRVDFTEPFKVGTDNVARNARRERVLDHRVKPEDELAMGRRRRKRFELTLEKRHGSTLRQRGRVAQRAS